MPVAEANPMRNRSRSWVIVLAVAGVLCLGLVGMPVRGQTQASTSRQPAPASQSQPPRQSALDFIGIWQAFTPANWDIQDHSAQPGPPQFGALFAEPPGQGIVEGNEIPYRPAALVKK